jgi:hypothetical protein
MINKTTGGLGCEEGKFLNESVFVVFSSLRENSFSDQHTESERGEGEKERREREREREEKKFDLQRERIERGRARRRVRRREKESEKKCSEYNRRERKNK